MLRKEDKPLFAALLTVALAIILAWAVPSPYRKENDRADKCATHECREDASAEALAEYTKGLFFVTAILAVASIFQGYFLIRADGTARLSATAAKKSADAAVAAERAYLLLSGRITSEIEPRPEGDTRRNIPVRVGVTFKNYGKSPAILHHTTGDMWSQTDPTYSGRSLIWVPQEEHVIGVGDESPEQFRFLRLKPEEFDRIFEEEISLFCSFGVAYDDVFGERHETVMLAKFSTGWNMFAVYPNRERNRRT